jgi:hypothetical protein
VKVPFTLTVKTAACYIYHFWLFEVDFIHLVNVFFHASKAGMVRGDVMTEKKAKLRGRQVLAGLVIMTLLAGVGVVRSDNPNERPVRPQINVEDPEDIRKPDSKIWVLNFTFTEPRLITADIPGRGRRLCWYLKYQVINKTSEPRYFRPDFELVTLDKPGVYHDQVLPSVQKAIAQIEDPLGNLDIMNSVTIANKPIPPSKPDAYPKAVHGVAIWDDVNADSNRYSIFVRGLSNGWSLAEVPPDNKQVVRVKTLQLNFKRLGDRYFQHSGEIRWVPPVEWVYRATSVTVPGDKGPAKKDAKKSEEK